MFRQFIIRGLVALCGSCALLFAFSTAAVQTAGSPSAVKNTLKQSGAYNNVGGLFNSGTAGFPAGSQDTAVQRAATSAITPSVAQQDSEQFVDGIFNWLNGKTSQPDFRIDLQPVTSKLLGNVGDQAVQRTTSLPACTLAQLEQINPKTVGIDSIPCLPPGMSADQVRQQAVSAATSQYSFLRDPVLTADSLPKDSNGQTVFQRNRDVPQAFQVIHTIPLITGIAALLLAGLVFLIQRDWRLASRRLAVNLLIGGITLVLVGFAASYGVSALKQRVSGAGGSSGLDIFDSILQAFAHNFTHSLFIFGGIYLLLAAAGLLLPAYIKRPKAADSTATPIDGPTRPNWDKHEFLEADRPQKSNDQPSKDI